MDDQVGAEFGLEGGLGEVLLGGDGELGAEGELGGEGDGGEGTGIGTGTAGIPEVAGGM